MLKRQEGYILKHIDDKTYLLPYGQKIADLQKGILLNDTGAFIWNALEHPQDINTLQDLLISHYALDSTIETQIREDVSQFIKQLLQLGILREELHRLDSPYYKTLQIANCIVRLYGPAQIFTEQFAPFYLPPEVSSECYGTGEGTSQTECSDMDIEIILKTPRNHQNGRTLLRNKELIVSCWEEGYLLQFPTLGNIIEAQITTNGSYVRIYCKNTILKSDCENLFLAIRPCFLYKAQREGCFAIHSASILYQDQAWLFSGHSGMGKSTHTALWHNILHTPYLNGDLNLVAQKNGQPVVYGIPWCGTSHISTAKTYPLGGIVLLGRADTDYIVTLEHYEKVLQVMQRMISPSWHASLMECNLNFANVLADMIPVYKLMCTKTPSALEVIKAHIDTHK